MQPSVIIPLIIVFGVATLSAAIALIIVGSYHARKGAADWTTHTDAVNPSNNKAPIRVLSIEVKDR